MGIDSLLRYYAFPDCESCVIRNALVGVCVNLVASMVLFPTGACNTLLSLGALRKADS